MMMMMRARFALPSLGRWRAIRSSSGLRRRQEQHAVPCWSGYCFLQTTTTTTTTAKNRSFASSNNNNKPTTPPTLQLDPALSDYLSQHLKLSNDHHNSTTISDKQQKQLHAKIVKTLQPVYGNTVTVAHLESFGKAGLQALAASILSEQQKKKKTTDNEKYVIVRFTVPHHRTQFDLKWYYESQPSLLDIAESSTDGAANELLSEYLEGTCGGNASCCSCHVYIDAQQQQQALSTPQEAELDMLDLAYQPTESSRLACQVRLLKEPPSSTDPDEPVLTVTIPPGVNNVWN